MLAGFQRESTIAWPQLIICAELCRFLNQNLPLLTKKLVNIYFNRRLDPIFRPPPVWAGEFGRGSKEATDKRPFAVNLTAFFAQMDAV